MDKTNIDDCNAPLAAVASRQLVYTRPGSMEDVIRSRIPEGLMYSSDNMCSDDTHESPLLIFIVICELIITNENVYLHHPCSADGAVIDLLRSSRKYRQSICHLPL